MINPFSGGKRGGELLRSLRQTRARADFKLELLETSVADFPHQVEQALTADCVVLAGGDGTVSEFLQHIGDKPVSIALMPLGTGNDLARFSGAAKYFDFRNPVSLLERYLKADSVALRVWEISTLTQPRFSRRFCNYVSYGIDGQVIRLVGNVRAHCPYIFRYGGKIANRLAYAFMSCACLCTAWIPYVRLMGHTAGQDNRSIEGRYLRSIAFTNIAPVMGFGISNPLSDPADDYLELLEVRSVFTHLSMLLSHRLPLPVGTRHPGSPAWSIDAISPGVCAQVDGEYVPQLTGARADIRLSRTVNLLRLV